MVIQTPVSDLARSVQNDPEQSWPTCVRIQTIWIDKKGRETIRTQLISADRFYGRGAYGAPIEGAGLIGMIQQMMREGPPKPARAKVKR